MMAGSEFERNVNAVLALVQKRGTIMLSDLAREIRIEPHRREAALGHLQTAHQIEITPAPSGPSGGRPSRIIRYIQD
jgi:predicted ArsR family transcriptional regulator